MSRFTESATNLNYHRIEVGERWGVRNLLIYVLADLGLLNDHELMLIGILLYPGVDLLDSGGPYEVFLTASRLQQRQGAPAPFEVTTISVDGLPVEVYGGLTLSPQHSAATVGDLDVLIVPGTIDMSAPLTDLELVQAIKALSAGTQTTASVCTGAFLLAETGLLDGRPWTTHWEDIDELSKRIGPAMAKRQVRWVDDGEIVTSAGLSSGLAMALHLVARFSGLELAEQTARQIDYDWKPDPGHLPVDQASGTATAGHRHNILLGGPNEKRMGLARAVRVGKQLSVGGTAAIAASGANVDPADIEAQARRCYEIIGEALAAAGAGFDDVVRTRTMLVDIADYEVALQVRKAFLGSALAAETIVQVVGFVDPDWRIEVEVDAVLT